MYIWISGIHPYRILILSTNNNILKANHLNPESVPWFGIVVNFHFTANIFWLVKIIQ